MVMGYPVTEYNPNSTERRDNGGPNSLSRAARRLRFFDTALTALAITAVIAAFHLVKGRLDGVNLASASGIGLLVGIVVLFFFRRRSGVFLTAGLRVLLIVILTASTSMITYDQFVVTLHSKGSPYTDKSLVNDGAQARALLAAANQALADKDQLLAYKNQLLAYKNQLLKNQNERFNKLHADIQKTATEEDKKKLKEEADQRLAEDLVQKMLDNNAPAPTPNVGSTGESKLGSTPINDILTDAFNIPPEKVEETRVVLNRTPLGQKIMNNLPLLVLGSPTALLVWLLGNDDVQVTVTHVITQLEEGQQIPSEDNLYTLFDAAGDHSQRLKLKQELMKIVSDAQRRKVMNDETAKQIESKFDEIIQQINTPLRDVVKQAIAKVTNDIKKGQPCNTKIPEIFSGFASLSEKRRALSTIPKPHQSVRDCMAQFGPSEVPKRQGK